jgi:hypothetical protein
MKRQAARRAQSDSKAKKLQEIIDEQIIMSPIVITMICNVIAFLPLTPIC